MWQDVLVGCDDNVALLHLHHSSSEIRGKYSIYQVKAMGPAQLSDLGKVRVLVLREELMA